MGVINSNPLCLCLIDRTGVASSIRFRFPLTLRHYLHQHAYAHASQGAEVTDLKWDVFWYVHNYNAVFNRGFTAAVEQSAHSFMIMQIREPVWPSGK